ncbi:MAG: PD-(D/E)XK nuclease family protein [Chromatiales bacterium]|nr:PD-(D/E)XK nuclease family protein [Chromatiales bacterium]
MTSTLPPPLPEHPAGAVAALAAGATVVTATERLARVLRREHDLARRAGGLTAWPAADVLPMGAFLARLAADSLDASGALPPDLPPPELAGLLWLDAVGDAGLDAGVLATAAARAWHAATLHGITLAQLQSACDSADAEALTGWVQQYRARLQATGYAELHEVTWGLARGERPLPAAALPRQLVVAGFDPLPPLYRALLDRFAASGVAVTAAPPPCQGARLVRRQAPDPATEIAAAAAWARERLEASPGARVAVVVADLATQGAAVRRAFLDVLDPGWRTRPVPGQRLAVSLGRPLAGYPAIHAALAWLEVVTGSAAWPAVSLVLRSPFVGLAAEAGARGRAEWRLRESGRTSFAPAAVVAALGDGAPVTAARLDEAAGIAAACRSGGPAQLAGVIGSLLAAAGWPGEAASGSTTAQALAGFRQLLETLAGGERLVGRGSLARFVGLLRNLAGERTFEPESDVAAVQVLGVLEAEGQAFDHLWITGLRADRWPPPARPLPLLPLALQRAAGIAEATPALLQALWARRFARLTAAAGEVVASWPDQDGEEELLPSPLLAGIASGEPAVPAASTRRDRDAVALVGPSPVVVDDPPPAFAGPQVRGGTRVLSLQATCPAEAFVVGRLHARALPPPPLPLTDAARGRVVHALLQELYLLPECRTGLARLARDALRAAFDTVRERVLPRLMPGSDPLTVALRAREAARLWRLVRQLREHDATRGDFTVSVEETRTVTVGGLELRVRLDRVEQHDGDELVLDYKTGQVQKKDWLPPRPADAQLPLYALTGHVGGVAVLRLRAEGVELDGVAEPAFGADLDLPRSFRNAGIDSWPVLVERWRNALDALAAEFRAGDFRIDSAARARADDQFVLVTRHHELRSPRAFAEPEEGE